MSVKKKRCTCCYDDPVKILECEKCHRIYGGFHRETIQFLSKLVLAEIERVNKTVMTAIRRGWADDHLQSKANSLTELKQVLIVLDISNCRISDLENHHIYADKRDYGILKPAFLPPPQDTL